MPGVHVEPAVLQSLLMLCGAAEPAELCSAAEPALSTASAFALDSDFCAAPSLILPSPETPLYNALLETLSNISDQNRMESLCHFFVFRQAEGQEALR